ncbi:MAG: hypothetical protein VX166_00680 [Pseudomonadota bacterium]|nr:hypothetical protein [Pseudomonadota bacterium]
MTTPTIASLRQTLQQLRRRRARFFFIKAASLLAIAWAVSALSISLVGAWLEPDKLGSIILFGLALFAVLLITAWFLRLLRLRHTDDRMLAHYVEDHIPDLEQRLLTSLEFNEDDLKYGRAGVSQQFIQQLWEDAQTHVAEQQREVETVAPAQQSWVTLATAVTVVSVISAVFLNSESLLKSGARLAWPFAISEPLAVAEFLPEIEISVEPGDLELQRGSSVTIIARVSNATPDSIDLRLQDDNVNWQAVSMSRDGSGSNSATYSYFIPSLQVDTTYYVAFEERGQQSSPQYQINLFDLPQIEQINLAFDYPDYTQLTDVTEEDSGDMIVPEGTQVSLSIQFNKAIATARVEFEESYRDSEEVGSELPAYPDLDLEIDGDVGSASFTVTQDGVYRIFATDLAGLESQEPLDYFIRAIEDAPPELSLRRPGRDQEVMPLEEVVLEVDASDDYGLSEFALNYSVVGSDEVEVDFLSEENVRNVSGSELIYLEDLEVEPGDFVSYFLTLADNNGLNGPAEVISDIYFLQIVPTDQEFRRNPGMSGGQGAGGGQGGDSSALVSVQKDIIAATWKLRNRQSQVSPEEFGADAGIIAESQREATGRARMSIDRLAERLNFSDDTYDSAVENLSLAIEQMNLAVGELDKVQITSALQPEQLALQYILKAEANINRTNVSMQQGGGGGGGGSAQQEREDLRELFEMEMGQLENRYETPNSRGGGSQQNQQEIDKLEELARRQEGLTRAQRNLARREDQMTEEQKRRELDRLMRQQEQLSREVAQLAQQMSRGQQSGQSSPQSASGSSTSAAQQRESAVQRAAQQMREAAESDSASIAAARSQKALENLRQQQQRLNEQGERSVNQLAQNLGQRGQQLLQQQRQLQERIAETSRQQGLGQTRQSVRNDESLQELIQAQQQQQRDLEEIEDMLRAIIARGSNEDQRLMSQAQEASRDLRPIREEMSTSSRVLRNGMVNLAVDIEEEIEDQLEELADSLAGLNPANQGSESDQLQRAAEDAENLREQVESLQQQALAFNESGSQQGTQPSLRDMRDQLQRSQKLAEQLQEQLRDQVSGGQQSTQAEQAGSRGNRQQIGGARGESEQRAGMGGAVNTDGNNLPWGNARSIRQQLTQQDIEDFINQPELFRQLLQPIIELEGALRAQAELDNINDKLYASFDEEVPEEYRDLVQEYYRVLSEGQGSDSPRQ